METINFIVEKIFQIGFFLSCLNIVRHAFNFIMAFVNNTTYVIVDPTLDTDNRLTYLGLSIATVVTALFFGFKI